MDNKEKIIEIFLEVLEQCEEIKKYIDPEKARKILEENILKVSIGKKSEMACYIPEDKEVVLPKNFIFEDMGNNEKGFCIHELLHALTTHIKEGKVLSGVSMTTFFANGNPFTKREAINEGITQWLAEKLVGEFTENKGLNNSNLMIGVYNTNGRPYSLLVLCAKELMILYGEGKVLESYFKCDISILENEIAKNSKIEDPDKKLSNYCATENIFFSELKWRNLSRRKDRNALKERFLEIHDYFIDEFLEKEIEMALQSGDINKIQEIKKKVEQLLALDIVVEGRGNVFYEVAKRFNEKVAEEQKVALKEDEKSILSKSHRTKINVVASILSPFITMVRIINKAIIMAKQEEVEAVETTKTYSVKPKSEQELINEIRGNPDNGRSNNRPNNRRNRRQKNRGEDNKGR